MTRGISTFFVFCVVLFSYAHEPPCRAPTGLSRLDVLHSVWTHHSLALDVYHENTPDKALFGGRMYSDKAPGAAALAFPGFAVAAVLLRMTSPDFSPLKGTRDLATCAKDCGSVR